ncbi:uncharacterized protein METZ01_LOCUS474822 [marine metagenome]|uniref:Uncharacterized protein n=1 Tax=marine metagenome TaxID=408172 RepID=A0A383BRH4_9ZZZZ
MYNYNCTVQYKNINGDASDTKYRKDFLCVFNEEKYVDTIFNKQNELFEKISMNKKLIEIIEKGKEFGFNCPIYMDNKTIFTMLFSYDFFESFHKCIQDLFIKKTITDSNYNEIINLLS